MVVGPKTLAQFLAHASFCDPASSPGLRALLLDLAISCRTIGRRLAEAPLRSAKGPEAGPARPPERQQAGAPPGGARVSGKDGRRGWIARARSPRGDGPRPIACHLHRGPYRAVLLPVDSPGNIELNATGGTIFSVFRTPAPGEPLGDPAAQGTGCDRICAGYAIHGPSLILVLAQDAGVQAFTLDRQKDEFMLTHADLRVPAATDRIAVDASRMRFCAPPLRRYVDECMGGEAGPRGKDFRFGWLGSVVAEAHCILLRGGIFIATGDGRGAARACASDLVEEVHPIAFVIEQAGGRASTGTSAILDVLPGGSPTPEALIFGSAEEVERIEAYHGDHESGRYDAPLFADRGLYRPSV